MMKKTFAIFISSLCLVGCQSDSAVTKNIAHDLACGTSVGKNNFCTDENLKVEIVEGIKIGGVDGALFYNSTVGENQKLVDLIKRALAKDKTAIKDLLNFNCGGGAGCYDLGFIFSQLVFKIGEDEFIRLIDGFSEDDKSALKFFISAGLEYGYPLVSQSPYKSRTIETEFPKLNQVLINN
ncbi:MULTISPECIES: hypothetical protein [unclassified Moraxella]|uniref:hypothetical protein n=1 Tax=unclassified Moraxella TaxID=2685852 RepID=UPI003AF73FEC